MFCEQQKNSISIAGFVPLTTVDYPDNLSAVVFCQGCPFKCQYCHNPNLISKKSSNDKKWDEIKAFLLKRKGLLDAVVFSGGEPTLQKNLLDAIILVRKLGYKVGIHTSGAYPKFLKKILPYLDWVGMDIKAPFEDYQTITLVPNSGLLALKSAKLLLSSNISYEFRTTVHPKLISQKQILKIADELKSLGATSYKLQRFRPTGCQNNHLCSVKGDLVSSSIYLKLSTMFDKFSII